MSDITQYSLDFFLVHVLLLGQAVSMQVLACQKKRILF